MALTELDGRTGHNDLAIETLDRGLKSSATNLAIFMSPRECPGYRGETGKLRLQIEELKTLG